MFYFYIVYWAYMYLKYENKAKGWLWGFKNIAKNYALKKHLHSPVRTCCVAFIVHIFSGQIYVF